MNFFFICIIIHIGMVFSKKDQYKKGWKISLPKRDGGIDHRFPPMEEINSYKIHENHTKFHLLNQLMNENISEYEKRKLANDYFESDLQINLRAGGLLFDFFLQPL